MKIKIISSGSKANCTLVCCGQTNILIDVGPTTSFINFELEKENLSPSDIDGIVITHTHSDHIKGLKTFVKKIDTHVYVYEDIVKDIIQIIPASKIRLIDRRFRINDVEIELLEMSHDVPCNGILLNYKEKTLVYITDTGYINSKHIPKITNKDIYIIESNYNDKMLAEGPYPYKLIQRIRSDSGHMSNRYCGKQLKNIIGDNTKRIYLAHISENNNTKDLALEEVLDEIKDTGFDKNKVFLTDQYEASEMIEV